MKNLGSLVLVLIAIQLPAQGFRENPRAAIEEVILEAYVRGVFNEGIVRNVELGFAPKFSMLVFEDNLVKVVSREQWIESIRAKKAAGHYPAPAKERVRVEFVDIDIHDYVASAKLRFYRGNKLRYIDFIDLYRFEEGWKIVGKTFAELPENNKQ